MKQFYCFVSHSFVDAFRKTKHKLQEVIGLELIHNGQFVPAFINVEKDTGFLLKQPRIQGAIQFPYNIMVMYDYLDEFRSLNWSSLCSGETSIQLKISEPNNLPIVVLKLGKSVCFFAFVPRRKLWPPTSQMCSTICHKLHSLNKYNTGMILKGPQPISSENF